MIKFGFRSFNIFGGLDTHEGMGVNFLGKWKLLKAVFPCETSNFKYAAICRLYGNYYLDLSISKF